MLEEVHVSGQLLDDLIPVLLEMQTRLKIESFYADPSEPENIERCRRKGVRIEPAVNDRKPGLDAVGAAIKAGMTVDPSCTGLLGEIPEYVWLRDRATGKLKEDTVKIKDDGCDALRYGIMALDAGGGFGDYYRDQTAALRAARAAAAA